MDSEVKNSPEVCAPYNYDSENKTCFKIDDLLDMVGAYNRYVSKIALSPQTNPQDGGKLNKAIIEEGIIKVKQDKKYLLTELHKRFQNICNGNEVCIAKQAFMNDIAKSDNDIFRVNGPHQATEWLNNQHIEGIMKQYEKVYSDFIFLGALPSNCHKHNLCSIYGANFDKYIKNGKKRVGIVYNLDKFGENGSHWVALFLDFDKKKAYYVDSTGHEPLSDFNEFIDTFKKYCKEKYNNDIEVKINNKKYQKDNSECGIYSCNFIIRILSGEKYEDIIENHLNFEEINSCRNVYFRNKSSPHNPHKLCDPPLYKKK
jgi:hypothetical protein